MDLLDLLDPMVNQGQLAHPVAQDRQGLLGHRVSLDRPDRKDQMDRLDRQENQEGLSKEKKDRKDLLVLLDHLENQDRRGTTGHQESLVQQARQGKLERRALRGHLESQGLKEWMENQGRMLYTALALIVQIKNVSSRQYKPLERGTDIRPPNSGLI
uniref:Nematode cuticle collagen N-terminal domain-containing protein n=1 Tax=Parascaris univalens TaxID=6257 RepID=A0A915ACU8_PARUN